MISKAKSLVIKLLDEAHLTATRILFTYIGALIVIPLFFGMFILFEKQLTRQGLKTMMANTPLVTVDIIVTIIDFLLGYYLWLQKDKILADLGTYRFLMLCQVISQAVVGNLFCAVLAVLGLVRTSGENVCFKGKNRLLKSIALTCLGAFCLCLMLIIYIK